MLHVPYLYITSLVAIESFVFVPVTMAALRCGSGMALGVWQRLLIPSWKGTTSNSHGVVFYNLLGPPVHKIDLFLPLARVHQCTKPRVLCSLPTYERIKAHVFRFFDRCTTMFKSFEGSW